MGERRGRPVVGLFIGVVGVVVGLGGGLVGGLVVVWSGFGAAEWALAGVLVGGLVLVVGCLWLGRRVATGPSGRAGYAEERFPDEPGPIWLVVEPGVEVSRFVGGVERVGFLASGTTVTEWRRMGRRVLVGAADGLSGWVDADRLRPPSVGEGAGDG